MLLFSLTRLSCLTWLKSTVSSMSLCSITGLIGYTPKQRNREWSGGECQVAWDICIELRSVTVKMLVIILSSFFFHYYYCYFFCFHFYYLIHRYKILFLDVLFPLHVKKIIFVDADLVRISFVKLMSYFDGEWISVQTILNLTFLGHRHFLIVFELRISFVQYFFLSLFISYTWNKRNLMCVYSLPSQNVMERFRRSCHCSQTERAIPSLRYACS